MEEESVQGARERARKAVRFFSGAGKTEREVWVVQKFLENFEIPFSDGEISTCQDEPVDVAFRTARFQVKEITDQGRERHREYKERERQLEEVSRLADLPTPQTYRLRPVDVNTISQRVARKAAELVCGPGDRKGYAPQAIHSVDLLCYANYLDEHVVGPLEMPIRLTPIAKMWRSISFMSDTYSGVLWATHGAPEFLKERLGHVAYRNLDDL